MTSANIVFLLVVAIIVVALVIWIATVAARAKRMTAASDARLAVQLQAFAENPLAATAPDRESAAERRNQIIEPAPQDDAPPTSVVSSTKMERLSELSELHAKDLITDDELATARAKILAE